MIIILIVISVIFYEKSFKHSVCADYFQGLKYIDESFGIPAGSAGRLLMGR